MALAKLGWEERGQGLTEYALILAVISVATALVLALLALGDPINSPYRKAAEALQ